STLAFARGDLSPAPHLYPPLYALLAAPFSWVTPKHPFFAIDLAALLVTAGAFLAVARRRVGMGWASTLLWLSLLWFPEMYHQFVFPWTTVLSAAIISLLILALDRDAGLPGKDGPWVCFGFAAVALLLVPTRPLDAVAAVPLIALFLWRLAA